MKSILLALAVEYWKRAGLGLLATIAAFVVMPALFVRFVLDLTPQPGTFAPVTFHFPYLGVALFAFCSIGYSPQVGLRERLYVMPLTTRFIVAWLLVMPMSTVALGTVVTHLLYDFFYDAQWPLFRPTSWLVLTALVLKVMYWRLLVGRARQLFVFAGILVFMLWRFVVSNYPDDILTGLPASNPMSWLEVLTMLTFGVVAWIVGQRTIARHRCGDGSDMVTAAKLAEAVEIRLREITSRPETGHASAAAAIRWYYWREGTVAAIGGGCIGACMLLLVQSHAFTSNDGNAWETTTAMLAAMPLAAGILLGTVQGMSLRVPGRNGDQVMSPFLATKPCSDRELATSLLAVTFQVCMVSWMIIVATAAILPTWILLFGDIAPLRREFLDWWLAHRLGPATVPCLLLVSLLSMWTSTSVVASFSFVGKDQIATLWWTILVIALVFFLVLPDRLPREVAESVRLGTLGCATLTVVGGTAFIYAVALRRRLLSRNSAGLAFMGWIVLALSCYFILPWDSSYRLGTCGLTMLSITPLAATPLALSWNRHR